MVVVEAVVLVVVIGAGAALASSQPAAGSSWQTVGATRPLAAGQPGDLVERLAVSPNRPGPNFITVDVFQTRRPVPGPIQQVLVTLRGPSGQVLSVPASAEADSRYVVSTEAMSSSGQWSVTVVVRRGGLPDQQADYPWVVANPAARLTRTVVSSAPLGGLLDWAAGLFAGLAVLLLGAATVVNRRAGRGSGTISTAAPSGRDESDPDEAHASSVPGSGQRPRPHGGQDDKEWSYRD
jgi:hypothetical protein